MTEINEQVLERLQWKDFSLLPDKNDQVLVLIYDDENKAQSFQKLLLENDFDLLLLKDSEDRHGIQIQFLNPDYAIETYFNKTEKTYPIRERIKKGVKYISTGIVDKSIPGGKHILYDMRLKELKNVANY